MVDGRVWDAAVVGAGPAGSMLAYELARSGAAVLLLDRAAFPRWKVCGCCLNPGTQSVLRAAGLDGLLQRLAPVPLHTLRIGAWGARTELPLGPSVALSRSALDTALAAAAEKAGARWVAPARARLGDASEEVRTLLVDREGQTATVRARIVVAADGVGSPILANAVGASPSTGVTSNSYVGLGGVYPADIPGFPPGIIHMAVGSHGYVGLVRLEDGTLDAAAAVAPELLTRTRDPHGLLADLVRAAEFGALPGPPPGGWRGTPRLTRTMATKGAHRLFAVGDAAGYIEPFTGEGMGWALASARALAPLVLEGLDRWQPTLVDRWDRIHEASVGSSARLCRALAWGLRRPRLTQAGLHLLRHLPEVAAPFVRRAGRPPTYATAGASR